MVQFVGVDKGRPNLALVSWEQIPKGRGCWFPVVVQLWQVVFRLECFLWRQGGKLCLGKLLPATQPPAQRVPNFVTEI